MNAEEIKIRIEMELEHYRDHCGGDDALSHTAERIVDIFSSTLSELGRTEQTRDSAGELFRLECKTTEKLRAKILELNEELVAASRAIEAERQDYYRVTKQAGSDAIERHKLQASLNIALNKADVLEKRLANANAAMESALPSYDKENQPLSEAIGRLHEELCRLRNPTASVH